MRSPQLLIVAVILTMVLSASVHAEIYKYTDTDGQKRWTDDLSQVPPEQRESAERIESVSSQTQSTDSDAQPQTDDGDDASTVDDTAEPVEAPSRDTLEQEKTELDTRYRELVEEREQLQKTNTEPMDAEARKAMNARIQEYNKKTEQYESQLNSFNEKVNAYNQKIASEKSSSANE